MDSIYTQRRYITEDVDRQWNSHNPEGKETIKMRQRLQENGKDNIFFIII